MAINDIKWATNDQVILTKQDGMVEDIRNSVDEIHPQYVGPTIVSADSYSTLGGFGSSDTFLHQEGVILAGTPLSRSYKLTTSNLAVVAHSLGFILKSNYTNINIKMDVRTKGTISKVFLKVFRHVDNSTELTLVFTSANFTSAATTPYDTKTMGPITKATLGSTGDFIVVYTYVQTDTVLNDFGSVRDLRIIPTLSQL